MTQGYQRNVLELIWAQATFSPTAPALILPDRVIPYATLIRGALSVQAMLASLPVQRGQLIALLIDNPAKHLAVLLGLMREGYTTTSIRVDQLAVAVQCGIQTVFTDVEFEAPTGVTRVNVDDKWFSDTPPRQKAKTWPEDRIARVVFTSGSTGEPRPIAFTFRAINSGIQDVGMYGFGNHQRIYTTYGLSSAAFKTTLYCLAYGRSIAFGPLGAAVHMIHNYALSCFCGSVAQARALLLNAAAMRSDVRIKTMVIGSASLPWKLHDELAWAFRADLVTLYSSTETGNIGVSKGSLLNRRPASGMYFYPTCDVQIVDDENRLLPPGKEGRIRARTSAMGFPFTGHLTQTRQAVGDGWAYSGDYGRLESDGLLLVLGRADELINDGGAKINPEQIEGFLHDMPDIGDVAAVSMPVGGNAFEPWLAVTGKASPTIEKINEWISKNVAGEIGALRFTRIIVVDNIPRAGSGKIARKEVRAKILEQLQPKS